MAEQEDAERLEELWAGDFGDNYVGRNASAHEGRSTFWEHVLATCRPTSVLEVGCNIGGNLVWLSGRVDSKVVGVDINPGALRTMTGRGEDLDGVRAAARTLPFRSGSFDLVFTAGVLIHQPTSTLGEVLQEMARCSARLLLCAEYFAEQEEEVPYRGHEGALFRRPYGALLQAADPRFKLREQGFLDRSMGWDDVTYWIHERS